MLVPALNLLIDSVPGQNEPIFQVIENGKRVRGYAQHETSLNAALSHFGATHNVVRFRQYGLTFYAFLRGDMVKNAEYLRIYMDCGHNTAQAKEVRILSGGKWRPVPFGFWQGR